MWEGTRRDLQLLSRDGTTWTLWARGLELPSGTGRNRTKAEQGTCCVLDSVAARFVKLVLIGLRTQGGCSFHSSSFPQTILQGTEEGRIHCEGLRSILLDQSRRTTSKRRRCVGGANQ